VADAGLLLAGTAMERLGLEALIDEAVRPSESGRPPPSRYRDRDSQGRGQVVVEAGLRCRVGEVEALDGCDSGSVLLAPPVDPG